MIYGRTSAQAVTPIAIDFTRPSGSQPMTVKLANAVGKLSLSVPKKLVMYSGKNEFFIMLLLSLAERNEDPFTDMI